MSRGAAAGRSPRSIAVVGVGLMGRRHVDLVRRCSGARLAAVVEPEAAAVARVDCAGAPVFADTAAMLERIPVDGVIVATPTAHHVGPVLAALERGVHVLLEKPVAATLAEAGQIQRAAQNAGAQVLVGHHRRHNPAAAAAKALIQQRRLGKLLGVVGQWTVRKPDSYFTEPWRQNRAAGPLLTNLAHDLDLLRFICGELESVYAETAGAVRRSPMEDSVSVALRFRSGALGTFFLSDAAPSPWTWEQGTGESPLFPWSGQNSMRFMGDRASLEFPNLRLWRCAADHGDWTRRPQPEDIPVRAGDAFMLQLEHFCAVLRLSLIHI